MSESLVSLYELLFNLEAEWKRSVDLLKERDRLLDAVPECPVHGKGCVPHAIEWVNSRKGIHTPMDSFCSQGSPIVDESSKERRMRKEIEELRDTVNGLHARNRALQAAFLKLAGNE